MSDRWKIFRFFNYIQLIIGLYFSYNILNNLINNDFRVSNVLVFVLIALFAFTIVANSLKNIFMIRYFSNDRSIPKSLIQIHTILTLLFCLYLIAGFFMLVLSFRGTGFALFMFLAFLITGTVVCVRQINLISSIREEQERKMNELISSIGTTPDNTD